MFWLSVFDFSYLILNLSLTQAKERAFEMLSHIKSGENIKASGVTFGELAKRLIDIKSATLSALIAKTTV